MTINVMDVIRRGRAQGRVEYAEAEVIKKGHLRAGNSGIMAETGDIAASCHRKTLLRSKGVEIDPPDEQKQIMFELGYASEDITTELMEGPLAKDGYTLLREADIPIDWTTSNGTRVTGRPDLVICKNAGPFGTLGAIETKVNEDSRHDKFLTPIQGIELKSVHSVWTVREVLFNKTPKLANLCQAGHYMWKLGVPYTLIYKSYSQLGQGMSWAPRMAAMFPKEGEPGSEYMSYNDTGIPLQVAQFEIAYDLSLDQHGRVRYREEGTEKWEYSLVTVHDIERYYEYVSKMEATGDLGPRPMELDAQGQKLNYTACKYCPMQSVCDKYETKGFDKWFEEIQKEATANLNK